jgi:hypothetical protein
MKNRMIKVWGIVLTLAILAGLLVASVPASAANLAWTPNAIPSTTNNFLLDPASPVDGWVYAASADGSTILAIDTTSTTNVLYKSVDGGVTFTTKNVGAGLPASGVTMLAIAADNTTAVASTGTALYGSTNGGNNWSAISLPSLTGTITAVDVIAGPTIVIGTSDGEFAVFGVAGGPFSGGWNVRSDWQNVALEGNAIIGIAFSPNYAADQTIVLVHNDGADKTYVSFAWYDQPVGTVYADKLLEGSDVSTSAIIAFPSDFNSSNGSFLVGLDDTGLWRISISSYATDPVTVAEGNNIYKDAGVTSLSFVGHG